ncbi:hypothetical protein [Leptospira sp. GIMC2001]|uniref:hypothetical protein n=1 Tax=Leptospira sp. GIMC2001 TaxID=1513297 RepID=UPI00234AA962|nr:hypothetical protein [Leptospira sp. GIMC2001]WCL47780.1 hypothetical protein O4O04_00560 [Leptospira sp. GIMC2001]
MKANTIFALGTANGKNEPFYTRCFLANPEIGDSKIQIHIPEVMSKRPMQDLKENPMVALTLADMTNFFARQVKGRFLEARPSSSAEIAQINHFQDKIKELMGNFFGPDLADGWKRYIVDPSVCITMEVQDVFEQTPKKGTGEKLI